MTLSKNPWKSAKDNRFFFEDRLPPTECREFTTLWQERLRIFSALPDPKRKTGFQ
jgi:hypothetical protein